MADQPEWPPTVAHLRRSALAEGFGRYGGGRRARVARLCRPADASDHPIRSFPWTFTPCSAEAAESLLKHECKTFARGVADPEQHLTGTPSPRAPPKHPRTLP